MAKLIIKEGKNIVSEYTLDKDVIRIGRSEENDLALDDIDVSRKHARIERREGKFVIVDLGSSNGTFFQGKKIKEKELQYNNEIVIGKYTLVFQGDVQEIAEEETVIGMPEEETVLGESAGETSLEVIGGESVGKIFPLDKDVISIGRAENDDIVLKGKSISRNHAKITRRGTNYVIMDLDSRNGVKVNGSLVKEKVLNNGDVIEIGSVGIKFLSKAEGVEAEKKFVGTKFKISFRNPKVRIATVGAALLLFIGILFTFFSPKQEPPPPPPSPKPIVHDLTNFEIKYTRKNDNLKEKYEAFLEISNDGSVKYSLVEDKKNDLRGLDWEYSLERNEIEEIVKLFKENKFLEMQGSYRTPGLKDAYFRVIRAKFGNRIKEVSNYGFEAPQGFYNIENRLNEIIEKAFSPKVEAEIERVKEILIAKEEEKKKRKALKKQREARQRKVYREIRLANSEIERGREKGADLLKAERLFYRAEARFEGKDYEEAYRLARLSKEEALGSIKRKGLEKEAKEMIRSAVLEIIKAEEVNASVERANSLCNQAKSKLERKDYEGALKLAKLAKEEAAKRRDELITPQAKKVYDEGYILLNQWNDREGAREKFEEVLRITKDPNHSYYKKAKEQLRRLE